MAWPDPSVLTSSAAAGSAGRLSAETGAVGQVFARWAADRSAIALLSIHGISATVAPEAQRPSAGTCVKSVYAMRPSGGPNVGSATVRGRAIAAPRPAGAATPRFLGGQLWHELSGLKHEAELVAAQRAALGFSHRVDALAREPDLAAVWGKYPGQAMQKRRLA
jgi:hypothetical protein